MSRKILTTAVTVVAAALFVLSGCDTGTDVGIYEVGDPVDINGVAFQVISVDAGGGWIANNTGDTERALGGTFLADVTLDADKVWYLEGPVRIGNNVDAGNKITIEPGTLIKGNPNAASSFLLITRGSQIIAEGTADAPIVFTSAKAVGVRQSGDWGGIIINGYAPIQGGTAEGEGDTGTYGGTNAADNSGTLKYVVVQFAGTLFTPDNELNGIAFQGVGSGTTVEYIQVHQNGDDGVEFFGGSVSAKYLVLTGNDDDALDFDDGWTGSAQYVVIQNYGDGGNAIEGDGDAADDIAPAAPILANFTIIGGGDDGPNFKNSADPDMYNSMIINYPAGTSAINEETGDDGATAEYFSVLIETEDDASAEDWDAQVAGENNAEGALGAFVTWTGTDHIASVDIGTLTEDDETQDDTWTFNAQPDSVTGTASTVPTSDLAGNAVDDTDFIGAVDPDGTDWTVGWTSFPAF